ncbi:MAG: cytochrome c peroxidase [Chthoniobacterales bacterium]
MNSITLSVFSSLCAVLSCAGLHNARAGVDQELRAVLSSHAFTGRVESTLEERLGRPLDPAKAELGRLLFFDKFVGLHGDNSCAGCHSPLNGFGDSVSMAIGVENNGFVGPQRVGTRNQRRSPSVVNTAFYPKLMWNGRFSATSGDPFDNSKGFLFPAPEGATRFPANDPDVVHLLQAQAHIPPTELSEAAGFTDICGSTDTSSFVQRRSVGGARLVKEPGSSKVRAVFDPLATSTVRMFGSKGQQAAGSEPDFCQFDVPAGGRAFPCRRRCGSHGRMAVSTNFVTSRSAMSSSAGSTRTNLIVRPSSRLFLN